MHMSIHMQGRTQVISVKSHPEPLNVRSFRTLDNVVPTKVYDEVYNLAGHKYHTTSEVTWVSVT